MEETELRDLVTDEDYDLEAERVRKEREMIITRRAKKAEKQQSLGQRPRVKSFAELVEKGRRARSNETVSDDDVVISEARGEEVELDDGEGGTDNEEDEAGDERGGATSGDTRGSSEHDDVAANSEDDVAANSGDDTISDGSKGLPPVEAKAGRNVEFTADDGTVMVQVGK